MKTATQGKERNKDNYLYQLIKCMPLVTIATVQNQVALKCTRTVVLQLTVIIKSGGRRLIIVRDL